MRRDGGRRLTAALADFVAADGFTSIISPTHYLDGPADPRIVIDINLARWLRDALNARARQEVRIYYRLAMPAAALATREARISARERLRTLDIDALWLRLHPFGTSTSGPRALRRYVDVCADLAELGIPVVAERTGTVGLGLLSFNLVGGIECGVTVGESFDATRLLRPQAPPNAPFSNSGMVYLPGLDAFVTRKEARLLLARRATKALLGCRDASCCRRGPDDMVRHAPRHGVIQRVREVVEIGETPAHRRPERYLARVTNAANLAARLGTAHPVLERTRERLDSWRGTLSALPADAIRHDAPAPAVGHRLVAASSRPPLRTVPTRNAR